MAAVKRKTEVLASVRIPDGDLKGEIDGLVIRQVASTGDWYILSKKQSIEWALTRLLWCKVLSDGRACGLRPSITIAMAELITSVPHPTAHG